MIKNIIQFGSRFMDYRMGALGALAMASLIFSINYIVSGNLLGSCTAALKQGTYTFFVGGSIIRNKKCSGYFLMPVTFHNQVNGFNFTFG